MTREVKPTMTPGRLAWLGELARGPARHHRTPIGFHCRKLGWSDWVYIDKKTGETMGSEEALRRYGATWFQHVEFGDLEMITAAGREALEKAT